MYTIKQAALRTGLAIPTIRAWERRYGVVNPTRTAGGYRIYDDEAIERLSAMRRLVEVDGVRPSQAAEEVRSRGVTAGGTSERRRAADGELAGSLDAEGGAPTPSTSASAVSALRDATRRLDLVAFERLLDEAFAAQRFEAAATTVIYPALRAIGEDWAAGEIDVAMEHAASEAIQRRLARFYDAAVDVTSPLDIVVGLPPGCQHEIGAMGFAVAARRRGLSVLYLGANVPVDSWALTSDALGMAVAVIGAIGEADVTAASAVVASLRSSTNRPAVVVGGRAASSVAAATDVVVLPDGMDAAVDVVLALVRSRPHRA
jgi:MerR family transcriptional regulator, light-induced transcriptional regulator